ncbi:unnamed protein product [Spirodela intermedia]|uniref:Peptidase A1 domain-containing protein n=1 Tax=Spirodela intermedia TaxID=51605 RepID=A0A7I8IPE3_SPIIN|nr:unnamed protein product [Spirodela intermedia]CAA6659818.1 unnamed protein product [Spirodela intermedia]
MDWTAARAWSVASLVRVLVVSALLLFSSASVAGKSAVFHVRRRFTGREGGLGELRAHDSRRHGRILAAVDLPLGGLGLPSSAGEKPPEDCSIAPLYFAQIGIGTPSKDYYVQVDTGSDLMWVNCVQCKRCPKRSDLGIDLTLYDPNSSSTSSLVTCDKEFCAATYGNDIQGCTPGVLCDYSVTYGDGSATSGYFVTDHLHYNQVTGNNQTRQNNANITFGKNSYVIPLCRCGAQQSGDLGSSSSAVDGILGFGQSNSSMISQLASSGKVRKIFAHCLDTVNGGGIFTIGHVVQPKVNTTPLVPQQPHYNVNMKAIEVDGKFLQLPSDIFDIGERKGTVIDSGTTLAYLPEVAYKPLMAAITSFQPNLTIETIQDFLCFRYAEDVDYGFPIVTLHFENSLLLRVYPHEYLFSYRDGIWCYGWQNGAVQSKEGKRYLVLSNKLVLYDLEKQEIGWTEYNCSSSIRVQDDRTGEVFTVNATTSRRGSRWSRRGSSCCCSSRCPPC